MSTKLDDGTVVFTQDEMDTFASDANKRLEENRDRALDQLKAAGRERDTLKEQLGGLDLDDARKAIVFRAEAERKKAEGEGDWTALEEQLKAAHGIELAKRDEREKKLLTQIDRELVTSQLTKAISSAKGDADLLLPHARNFVKTRETDDGFEAYVVDKAGNPLFSDGQGTPMTFTELVEQQLVEQYPRAFDGTGSSGSGASKSDAGGGRQHTKTVAAGDDAAFIANLDGIADGSVQVQ